MPAAGSPATVRESLNAFGEQLLRGLPPTIRLDHTAARYPHIVNKLAVVWNDAGVLSKYLHSLLVDDRIRRQGFEFETLSELTDVRNFRLAVLLEFERKTR